VADDAVPGHRGIEMTRLLCLAAACAALVACTGPDPRGAAPLRSGTHVDLERYMGTWHVIANVPYFAENGKVATRDEYRLDADGNVATTYVYRKAFGQPEKTLDSLGIVQPGSNNAYWIVRLFWLIRADYLVLEVAADYSWALVGQPSGKLGWVLARDAAMDDAQYASLLEKFRGHGYAPERFRRVPQFPDQAGKPGFQ
jgi:apolipoprotein D and lipocalin family protein